jgi:hypothetical protein
VASKQKKNKSVHPELYAKRSIRRGLVVELWLVTLLGADQQPHIGDGEHSDDITQRFSTSVAL